MKKPAFARLLVSLAALALAAPGLAQQNGSASDFQLPTERTAPRQERAQGPVDEGVPAPRVVRPTPTPAAQSPVIAVDPGPSTTTPGDPFAAIDAMGRTRPAPAAPAGSAPTTTATGIAATQGDEAPVAGADAAPATASIGQPVTLPPASASAATAPANEATPAGMLPWWAWLLAIVAVGAAGTFAGWVWRGRRATEAPYLAPQIERPKVPERIPERTGPPAELPPAPRAPQRQPPPVPVAAPEPDHEPDHEPDEPETALRIALEPARLSVSLLNATLSYRLLLTNSGDRPLRDITIDGDMVSAHASLSQAEQLAAPTSKLENRHLVRMLGPGETTVVSGDFALPLPLIRPIRKGEATLFVPLARLRVIAAGENAEVLVQTSVVGQRSQRPGGGLRPFRLDLGPRIYSELGQRAFA